MASSSDLQAHPIVQASKARALLAVLVPVAFPFIMALALAKSGRDFWDYAGLIESGQLSLIRQGLMWVGILAFVAVYVPPALTALTSRNYLASTASELITPSGERFDLAKVKGISVRKTFWHKVLWIELPDHTRRIVVTFARPFAPEIKDALKADRNLLNIPVS
jgi:hypothetical protein